MILRVFLHIKFEVIITNNIGQNTYSLHFVTYVVLQFTNQIISRVEILWVCNLFEKDSTEPEKL